MVLLLALAAGLLVGVGWARRFQRPYEAPALQYLSLAFTAFLPQFVVIYQPLRAEWISDRLSAICLLASMLSFLGFVWLNRRVPGMNILLVGLALNLTVMALNGGFMPISPRTASHLVTEETLMKIPPGTRFGVKDILLLPEQTRFEPLSDRFLPPVRFPYQVAFSLGDVFIAVGAFAMLAWPSFRKIKGASI